MTLTQPKIKKEGVKTFVIALLVTVLFSLVSGAYGFWSGINYAHGEQHQADARVEKALVSLKADASK